MHTESKQLSKQPKGRLLALDILRGITIAGMILVNNPGSWGKIYAPLRHAEWNGLTPTDLVFPFFMFIMGISTYFSLRKYDFTFSWPSFVKIIRRTIVIFAIGIGIAWFGLFLRGILNDATFSEAVFNFDRIRILGVMPRLALCYGIGATIALLVRHTLLPWVVAGMLVLYSALLIFGNGFAFSDSNIISIIDHKILGPDHMDAATVGGVRLKFDPEGLLGTIPSIAHVLIGFICGGLIAGTKDNTLRVNRLFIVGTTLTFAGFLLSYGLPFNKKIWSPTFVLTTCGLAASLLALLIWVIDIKGRRRWTRFFEVFGVNPLFLFCISGIVATILGSLRISCATAPESFVTIKNLICRYVLEPVSFGCPELASLLWAIFFIVLNWLIGLPLYRKKIYIKI